MFSQNDEERVILEFFKGVTGNFLDIGAYNGLELSNTRQLALSGWKGIMLEPAPEPFAAMAELYRGAPNVVLVNAAMSSRNHWVDFHFEKTRQWAGTISPECLKKHQIDVRYSFKVMTVTPDQVSELGGSLSMRPFHFVSIDAEWMDFDIVEHSGSMLDLTELLCVEKAGMEWMPLLNSLGFVNLVHNTPENILVSR